MLTPSNRLWKSALFLECESALLHGGVLGGSRFAPGAAQLLRTLGGTSVQLLALQRSADQHAAQELSMGLRAACARCGTQFGGIYCCGHGTASCECAMPRPALLWRAARERRLDLQRSWMVSGTLDGIEAGRRAGCRTILVDNGSERRWNLSPIRTPHHCVAGLDAVARIVLSGVVGDRECGFDGEPLWNA